jgi:hypothetical protein
MITQNDIKLFHKFIHTVASFMFLLLERSKIGNIITFLFIWSMNIWIQGPLHDKLYFCDQLVWDSVRSIFYWAGIAPQSSWSLPPE